MGVAGLVDAGDAVGKCQTLSEIVQGTSHVAFLLGQRRTQTGHLGFMFQRTYAHGNSPCRVEIVARGRPVVSGQVGFCQGHGGLQPVPLVAAVMQHVVGAAVVGNGGRVVVGTLVQAAKVDVAQGHTEPRPFGLVLCQGTLIIDACRVQHALRLEDGTYVGEVYGLTQVAAQRMFRGQSLTEDAVGKAEVAHAEVYVAEPVEGHHAVLAGGKAFGVGVAVVKLKCRVILLGGIVQQTHTAVVGTYIIIRAHGFDGVEMAKGKLQTLAVGRQRILKVALIA